MAQNQFSMDLNLKAYPNQLTPDVDGVVAMTCTHEKHQTLPLPATTTFYCNIAGI